IHGGGIDLVFPHHENEIAQTRCAFHSPVMADFWMHNGFLQVEGRKMAKSEGNFVTIRKLLADWPGEVLRLNMLRTHYRQPINWTLRGLEESLRTLETWSSLAVAMDIAGIPHDVIPDRPVYPPLLEALSDDLNTPKAVVELHNLRNALVHAVGQTLPTAFSDALRFLGLLQDDLSRVLDRRMARTSVDRHKVE